LPQPKRQYKFPASNRLKNSREFLEVQEKAAKHHCKHFLILIAASDKGRNRLGITVTKKIDKRAVKRNKIKRRIRDIFRLNQHLLRENFDIIIIARKNAAEIEYKDTAREILGTLDFKGYLKK
jgi:ribonuclease P protein component